MVVGIASCLRHTEDYILLNENQNSVGKIIGYSDIVEGNGSEEYKGQFP